VRKDTQKKTCSAPTTKELFSLRSHLISGFAAKPHGQPFHHTADTLPKLNNKILLQPCVLKTEKKKL